MIGDETEDGGEVVAAAPPQDFQNPEVAEVLQRLRSGVRQRQAEAATVALGIGGIDGIGGLDGGAGGGAGPGGLAQSLLAVKSHEYVQEPAAFSHRPRLGKLIVVSRKGVFHLFLKWFLRPVMQQQNAFNQAAGRLLQELAEARERTAREARLLAARVALLESRLERAAGAAGAAGAAAPQPREAMEPPEPAAQAGRPELPQPAGLPELPQPAGLSKLPQTAGLPELPQTAGLSELPQPAGTAESPRSAERPRPSGPPGGPGA